jgi:hypothetical protein
MQSHTSQRNGLPTPTSMNKFMGITITPAYPHRIYGIQPTTYILKASDHDRILRFMDAPFDQNNTQLLPMIHDLRKDGYTRIAIGVDVRWGAWHTAHRIKNMIDGIPGVEFVSNMDNGGLLFKKRHENHRVSLLVYELGHSSSKM